MSAGVYCPINGEVSTEPFFSDEMKITSVPCRQAVFAQFVSPDGIAAKSSRSHGELASFIPFRVLNLASLSMSHVSVSMAMNNVIPQMGGLASFVVHPIHCCPFVHRGIVQLISDRGGRRFGQPDLQFMTHSCSLPHEVGRTYRPQLCEQWR